MSGSEIPSCTSIQELFDGLDFSPARIIVSKKLHDAVKQEMLVRINVAGHEMTLRSHPAIPDDMIILFGADGSFAVMRLEEEQDEIRS